MLGLGTSLISGAPISTSEELLRSAFDKRVTEDGGVLENDACLLSALKELTTESTSFTTGFLEFYPNAAAAYSLRQLRRSVFPYAVRVRRGSDSQEQDIGFNNNGELDTNALLNFANGGDAWVAVWYDQSSNAHNATQTTPARQPQIVTSGSLITENGKPAVQFTRTSEQYLQNANNIMTGSNLCNIVVAKANSSATQNRSIIDQSGGSFGGALFQSASNGYTWFARFSGTYIGGASALNPEQQRLLFSNYVSGSSYLAVDGSIASTQVATFSGSGDPGVAFWIGGDHATSDRYFDGKVQEIFIYNSDQDSSRQGIESKINDFYSIY